MEVGSTGHAGGTDSASLGSRRKRICIHERTSVGANGASHPWPLLSVLPQTLQMGIKHFSGLFVLLCAGLGLSILTAIGEHIVYRLLLPRIKNKSRLQYWLHTSQVSAAGVLLRCSQPSEFPVVGGSGAPSQTDNDTLPRELRCVDTLCVQDSLFHPIHSLSP